MLVMETRKYIYLHVFLPLISLFPLTIKKKMAAELSQKFIECYI